MTPGLFVPFVCVLIGEHALGIGGDHEMAIIRQDAVWDSYGSSRHVRHDCSEFNFRLRSVFIGLTYP